MTFLNATLIWIAFIVGIASWFHHLFVCFTEGLWGFLIAGAIFFPIGIVHGFGHWIGLWG